MVRWPAPARASSTQMARDAPPAPNTITRLPLTSTPLEARDIMKPLPSVFSPKRRPLSLTIMLTAPMSLALSEISSRYFMTSILWGMVQLMPRILKALRPLMAFSSWSLSTSRVRKCHRSRPMAWKAASWITTPGFSATGWPNTPTR